MYPLELPVLAAPHPAPPTAMPFLSGDGTGQAFPELLAALSVPGSADAAEVPDAEPGNELPQAAEASGNVLPVALPVVLPAQLLPTLVMPQVLDAKAPPASVETLTLPKAAVPAPDNDQTPGPHDAPPAHKPVAAHDGVAVLAELSAPPLRTGDPAPAHAVAREVPSSQSAAPAPALAQSSTSQPAPGTQLEQLVEVLAQAREAGKAARGDLTVRHAEFGLVAIRIDQADGEIRAQISGRDPGFAPAVVAALAERSNAGFSDQQQRGQDQSGPNQGSGQHASANTDARQQERRSAPVPAGTDPAPQQAATEADDDRNQQPSSDRRGRFA